MVQRDRSNSISQGKTQYFKANILISLRVLAAHVISFESLSCRGVPSAAIVHAEGKWAYVFYSTEKILRIANCGLYENMSSFVTNYYSSKVIIPI